MYYFEQCFVCLVSSRSTTATAAAGTNWPIDRYVQCMGNSHQCLTQIFFSRSWLLRYHAECS